MRKTPKSPKTRRKPKTAGASRTPLVIGMDYGTDSVRCVIVDAADGHEVASAVHNYGRWARGLYCDAAENRFRQHPDDYLDGIRETVREALAQAPAGSAARVRGISIDTTGSTPVAVDRAGTPLSLRPEFRDNPNAMFVLWKDHTAIEEAARVNETARGWGGENFTRFSGGVYSSEWFWAKILHILRTDPAVREAAFSWVEHCDWMSAVLTGKTDPLAIPRSRCAAGHKAMWNEAFGGLPSEDFLVRVDPLLGGLRKRLYRQTVTADAAVGTLSPAWARELGLRRDVVVGSGAFDAHMGAVGGQIEPHVLVKIMGTSTCDMLIAPHADVGDRLIAGICGQVDGSIVPGMVGMEAGQSAFGDVYAWFKTVLMWPLDAIAASHERIDKRTHARVRRAVSDRVLPELARAAEKLGPGAGGLTALDWINGRRTPDANQALTGAIAGLRMGTDAARIYRALVEATAFGSRRISERFDEQGVKVKSVIALGGIASKSPFVMQVVADVLNAGIKVVRSQQACALGAAMFAAVVAGVHKTVQDAQRAMGSGFEAEYRPSPERAAEYDRLYARYQSLGRFVEQETVS
ncbi:MAG: ribulokinase [Lentisphaerae bacterium]|nr:ribulokinase [Lentisphaerota bacterium]